MRKEAYVLKFLVLVLIANAVYSSINSQVPQLILQKPHKNAISYAGINKNNGLLYTFSGDEKLIKIWNPKYRKLIKEVDLSFCNGKPYCFLPSHGLSILVYDNKGIHLLSEKGDRMTGYNRIEDDQMEHDAATGNILIIHKDGIADILNTKTGSLKRIIEYANNFPLYNLSGNGILTYSTVSCAYAFDMKDATIIDSIPLSRTQYQESASSAVYMNDSRTKIALVNQQGTYILNVGTHDTTAKLPYHRSLYSFRNQEWFTPGMEKLLYLRSDTLHVVNVESGKTEQKLPARMNLISVQFLPPDLIQFQAIGYNLLFDWKKNRYVFLSGLLMDDIVHLSGRSVKYTTSPDGQYLYTFRRDSLLAINLHNADTPIKIKTSFTHDIKSICSDNAGGIYLTGMDENQHSVIQKWDARGLKFKSVIPDGLPVGYQQTTWARFDSVGNLTTLGFGAGIKKWYASHSAVDLNDTAASILVVDNHIFITQDTNDTGRIVLQLRDVESGLLLKEIRSEVYNGVDFFTRGIVSNGHIFLPTNFSSDVYEWDIPGNRLNLVNAPKAFGTYLLKPVGDYLVLGGVNSQGKIGLINTKLFNKKAVPVVYDSDLLDVSPADGIVAYIKHSEIDYSDKPTIYHLVIEKIATRQLVQKIDFQLRYATLQKMLFSPKGDFLTIATSNGLITWGKTASGFRTLYTDTSGIFYSIGDVDYHPVLPLLYYVTSDKKLNAIHLSDGKHAYQRDLLAIPHSVIAGKEKLAVLEQGNFIQLYQADNLTYKYLLIDIGTNGWQILLPGGYYTGSKNIARDIGFSIWPEYYDFSAFDARFNRPDVVSRAMGSVDTTLIQAYHNAYLKRIRRLGIDTSSFTEGFTFPEADFVNRDSIDYDQANNLLKLHIAGRDSSSLLDRFNIWINETPLFGMRGYSIRNRNTKRLDTTLTVVLSDSLNNIETSVINVNAIESYRIPLQVNYTSQKPNPVVTRFIGVGIDNFKDSDHNLAWSVTDIRNLATSLKRKHTGNITIDTLFNQDVTVDKVKALKQALYNTTINDKVIIAYSGHGLLSDSSDYYLSTYDVNFNKPEEGGLSYDVLEDLLDNIPARKKLMLLDACHSGEVDKEEMQHYKQVQLKLDSGRIKRGTILENNDSTKLGMKNSFELMLQIFVNVGRSTGATVISASAGTQFALEKNDLKNGVFTYSILEYMKDHSTCTVTELKNYVNKRVSELTERLQQPTARTENIMYDWKVW